VLPDEDNGRGLLDVGTQLSARQREVLAMAARGLTNAEMAERLGVTVHAVKFHLAAIYRKLGVSNRTEAAVLYLRAAASRSEHPRAFRPLG
jgi:DNA-binding CsgD family transcriptional regulator